MNFAILNADAGSRGTAQFTHIKPLLNPNQGCNDRSPIAIRTLYYPTRVVRSI
jgi:hypothetical protein